LPAESSSGALHLCLEIKIPKSRDHRNSKYS
jgi:hypothetical protein